MAHLRSGALTLTLTLTLNLTLTLTPTPTLTLSLTRLPERAQASAAALLYLSSVLVFTASPLAEWRLVLGLVLGLKAQILFMAPFTAAFSRLMGGTRVTNSLTTALCLAPLIGTALDPNPEPEPE